MYGKYYEMAQEYIATHDLNALPLGKTLIDGENLFVNICDSPLKAASDGRIEVHNKYIDIQIPLSIPEAMGMIPRAELKEEDGPFNQDKDCGFYKEKNWKTVVLQPGEQITFAPDMGHAPVLSPSGKAEGVSHKAIFKVLVSE